MSRGEGPSLNPDNRTHRKAFPVTDYSRNRTELFGGLKLSHLTFSSENSCPRVDVCGVGYSAPLLCPQAGTLPQQMLQLTGGPVLAGCKGTPSQDHDVLLCWVRADDDCSSREYCSEQHKAYFLFLRGHPLQPIPPSAIYSVPAAVTTKGTFKHINESIGGLLNRNALKSFEKSSRCTASQNWFPWCRILHARWIFLCCFSLL